MLNKFFRPKLIVGSLPVTLTNGTTADATQVMSDLNWIVNQINANAAPLNNPTFTGILNAAVGNFTNITASGLTTPTGGIKGISTNTDAAAGNVDEAFRSWSNFGAVGATGVYGDLVSINLTAGDWDVTGQALFQNNAATWTQAILGISSTSGNSAAGLVDGDNMLYPTFASTSAATIVPVTIANFRVSLAAPATYYLKVAAVYSAGGPPSVAGRLSARRRQPGA